MLGQSDSEEVKRVLLQDYVMACYCREIGILIRKETLGGRAKFGIAGDGKEMAQIALSKCFQNGDMRSGYYRDHVLVLSIGQVTGKEIFAQLYAHTDLEKEPNSGGRQMVSHFATRFLDADGKQINMLDRKLCIADLSPTAGQIPRILGLGLASKFYRNRKDTDSFSHPFSRNGDEVVFGTLGDASTSQGAFLEFFNAAAVLQIPVVMSIWDDGYGISVPKHYQTAKSSISKVLSGFKSEGVEKGWKIFQVKGWDYPALLETYKKATDIARQHHTPVLVHVTEMTQPTSHSTSSDHRAYKSEQQLKWEQEFDCIKHFESWLLEIETDGKNLFQRSDLDKAKEYSKSNAKADQKQAFQDYRASLISLRKSFTDICTDSFSQAALSESVGSEVQTVLNHLKNSHLPLKLETYHACKKILRLLPRDKAPFRLQLKNWLEVSYKKEHRNYSSHLYSESLQKGTTVEEVTPRYASQEQFKDGRVILQENFDKLLTKHPELIFFGEDVGLLGGGESVAGRYAEKIRYISCF